MRQKPIRVLVVDDHEVVRAGLMSLFGHASDLLVIGTLSRAEDAIGQLDALAPDVIVLDHRLDGMSGAVACAEITRRRPATSVIMLTSSDEDSVLLSCLAAGAKGFLLKTADAAELLDAVRTIAAGNPVVTPKVLDRLLCWVRTSERIGRDSGELCPEEVAVLSLAAQGRKNREIARSLKVTEGTVRTYLRRARTKLGARERSEAVLAGIRRGMI